MGNVYFFQIKEIAKDSLLLDEVKKQGIFFSYFQIDKEYYPILYNKKLIEIDSFLTNTDIIKELNSKKRKIRSISGFLLYALKIIQDEKLITVLKTNFQHLFWPRLKKAMKQNKKDSIAHFLFKSSNSINLPSDQKVSSVLKEMTSKISSLKKQQVEMVAEVEKIKAIQLNGRFVQKPFISYNCPI